MKRRKERGNGSLKACRKGGWTALAVLGLLGGGNALRGQSAEVVPAGLQDAAPALSLAAVSVPVLYSSSTEAIASAADGLPEAPVPQFTPAKPAVLPAPGQPPLAPIRAKTIPAGWRAQRLTVKQKIDVGTTDLYSFDNFAATFLSAGYEHVLNSEPNYGTDKGAFGERLGAAAIRESSQGIFTDMVFSPILREDTRYYVLGPDHNPIRRTLYAITRPLITRTDNGGRTVNGALLLGYAASAGLTPAFYPESNRNFHDVASTFGDSIGGAALGFFVSEFSSDVLVALHLRK